MTEPERHDWQQIIYEVRAMYFASAGKALTDYKLGLMIGLSHMSVAILAQRGEPKHRPGQLLLEWHRELLRKTCLEQSDAHTT